MRCFLQYLERTSWSVTRLWCKAGKVKQRSVSSMNWGDNILNLRPSKPKFKGQNIEGNVSAHRELLEEERVLSSSTEYWSVHLCEKITQSRKTPKRSHVKTVACHIWWEIIHLHNPHGTEKLRDTGDVGWSNKSRPVVVLDYCLLLPCLTKLKCKV
jgi:hypothetical protein